MGSYGGPDKGLPGCATIRTVYIKMLRDIAEIRAKRERLKIGLQKD